MTRWWLTYAALAAATSACVHRAETSPVRSTQAEARTFQYSDEAGLTVWTLGAAGSHDVSPSVQVAVTALADHILNEPPPVVRPIPPGPGQPTGHLHPGVDVVSSASVLAVDERVRTDKWRFEGIAAALVRAYVRGNPATGEGLLRGSTEPDYRSVSGRAAGTLELFERNTTLYAFLGAGHDLMIPLQAPPGQESLWPATHNRWNVGGSITQLVSPEISVSAGLGFTHQWGMLASPYRRALVYTTLFPEILPNIRARTTAFVAGSLSLGGGTALHLRQGAYLDTWGVWSLIPEVHLAKEVGRAAVVSFRYRYYRQQAASFYEPVYPTIEPLLSGDPRLGKIREHVGAVALRWTPWGRLGWREALTLHAAYELSILTYPLLSSGVRAHVFTLGAMWGR